MPLPSKVIFNIFDIKMFAAYQCNLWQFCGTLNTKQRKPYPSSYWISWESKIRKKNLTLDSFIEYEISVSRSAYQAYLL
nr:unnamed protein product [Callosobruchus chinensis]